MRSTSADWSCCPAAAAVYIHTAALSATDCPENGKICFLISFYPDATLTWSGVQQESSYSVLSALLFIHYISVRLFRDKLNTIKHPIESKYQSPPFVKQKNEIVLACCCGRVEKTKI